MKSPNILLILIDDLGWRDLGCYGSTFYETPRIDALATEGVVFTSAYATAPVCSPTRASVMSGKYPARVGVTDYIGGASEGRLQNVPYLHYLPAEEKSVACTLSEAGYSTWHVGKWHLGGQDFYPEKHGFDVNVAGCHCGMPPQGYFSPYGLENLEDGPDGEYLTDRLTDEAVSLIKNRGDKPFFLNLSHYAVHTPIEAPEELVEKYRQKATSQGLDKIQGTLKGEPFEMMGKLDKRIERRLLQSDPFYAAMIENLDTNIGKVLDALDAEGIADETLVIFTSDNGGVSSGDDWAPPTCNLPLAEGKGWNYEGGTRVCQTIRWPSHFEPGLRCSENVQSCDFYPTILEAAGLPLMPEQHVDGLSLMPLLRGAATQLNREAIFWHYPHYSNLGSRPAASVISGDWKLIENFEDNRLELFHLDTDISEQRNRVDREPEMARKLKGLLDRWKKDVEAKIPQPNPQWEEKQMKKNQ